MTSCSTCGLCPRRGGGSHPDGTGIDGGRPAGIEFLVLTAAQWGEVRWAEGTEIDRDEGVWTVPARQTKANREPLCGGALEFLDEARNTRGRNQPIPVSQSRW